ncbi:hypothetical protein MKW94_029078 [Papaver nudicaule]|uniref:RING-type domain-containing protein n=1 Tax=Papaver nudicaule TaxID=74823 RepID=A0AA41VV70_PAPNU|nr:hypothetical protein [Papaver nudicaule]MCL7051302.1 hypothetical protein [Papaver nudicaule]
MDYVVDDWRNHLSARGRQIILAKLVQALAMHQPPDTTKSFAERWEADIYNSATSRSDYLVEICRKMVTDGIRLEDGTIANTSTVVVTPRGHLPFEQESVKRKVEEADSVCPVCLDCLKTTDEIREMSRCSHVFHKGCLDRHRFSCPCCRARLQSSLPMGHKKDYESL